MLALQAFMCFAEMPSIPVAFFTLDFSVRISMLSGEIGLSRKLVHSHILNKLIQHLGVFRYPRGEDTTNVPGDICIKNIHNARDSGLIRDNFPVFAKSDNRIF